MWFPMAYSICNRSTMRLLSISVISRYQADKGAPPRRYLAVLLCSLMHVYATYAHCSLGIGRKNLWYKCCTSGNDGFVLRSSGKCTQVAQVHPETQHKSPPRPAPAPPPKPPRPPPRPPRPPTPVRSGPSIEPRKGSPPNRSGPAVHAAHTARGQDASDSSKRLLGTSSDFHSKLQHSTANCNEDCQCCAAGNKSYSVSLHLSRRDRRMCSAPYC